MARADVAIVGAGLAGLCCALHLQEAGREPLLLEAADHVGGRVRTDRVEGFLLDRGFQVLQTAYPEARRMLDYRRLEFRPFEPGALVRFGGKFHRVADPARRRWAGFKTVFTPIGSLGDKLKLRAYRKEICEGSLERVFARPDETSLEALRWWGFSDKIIQRFFRPLFSGIFLERNLRTSGRMLAFVFRMLAQGDVVLPAAGMQAIPDQLAERLRDGAIRLNARVQSVESNRVILVGGETVEADAVVVATEGPEAARLLSDVNEPGSCSVACLSYAADEPPVREPLLVLNGDGEGPVNDLCVPSRVAPEYAPEGRDLVSATVVAPREDDDAKLEAAVRKQCREWFGESVDGWRLLRVHRIRHALPGQPPPTLEHPARPVCVDRGLFVCGDHRDTASIQGAMVSGHRAAEAVLAD